MAASSVRRLRLQGYGQAEDGADYVPIVSQDGRYRSRVLGLDLAVEGPRVRFFAGSAPLLDAEELAARLEHVVQEVTERAEHEAQRAEHEAQRAEHERSPRRTGGSRTCARCSTSP